MAFLAALQFLTILPIRANFTEKQIGRSSAYFPLVGAVLGLILVAANKLLLILFPEQLANLFLVSILIITTGGLHLDGLADTFDAFGSGKGKDAMLVIMRDSRIGTFGVIGVVSAILFKVFLLSAIPSPIKLQCLLLMPALSRWSMTIPMLIYPYARSEGKAKLFIDGMNYKVFLFAGIMALSIAVINGRVGIGVFLISAISTFVISRFIARKIGGMTGDTLGATCELSEVAILLSAVILTKLFGP